MHYEKITDVLDVWFDSGVSHECVLKQRPELLFLLICIWKVLINIVVGFNHPY